MVADNQFAAVDVNTIATQTLVAAVTGKRIYVLGYQLVNGVATVQTIQFRSGSNNLSGVLQMPQAIGGTLAAPVCDRPRCYFFTDVGAALTIVQTAATQVGGFVQYIQV